MFMPALHRNKDSAAMVGRMLTGYGELEYLLAQLLGYVIEMPIGLVPAHSWVS